VGCDEELVAGLENVTAVMVTVGWLVEEPESAANAADAGVNVAATAAATAAAMAERRRNADERCGSVSTPKSSERRERRTRL
jgi:hypothetical protein